MCETFLDRLLINVSLPDGAGEVLRITWFRWSNWRTIVPQLSKCLKFKAVWGD